MTTNAEPNKTIGTETQIIEMGVCRYCMCPVIHIKAPNGAPMGPWIHALTQRAECLPPMDPALSERSNPPGAND